MSADPSSKYAVLPQGSLWPFTPVVGELLERECMWTYTVTTNGTGSEVLSKSSDGLVRSIPIPRRYTELMKRFIWRGEILRTLLYSVEFLHALVDEDIESAMINNLWYHFKVFDILRPALRAAVASTETDPAIRLLEVYMLEEFYVGRHEPAAVARWQMTNQHINLRCSNVFDLG